MSTLTQQADLRTAPEPVRRVVIYGHTGLFYWWPVWALGYLFALLTYFQGVETPFGDFTVKIHPSHSLGVIYTVVFFLVIVLTNVAIRGYGSLTVIVSALAITFLFAYLGWWDDIFRVIGNLAIFMNLGFYVFFSSAIFLAWLLSVFIYARIDYYEFVPGQLVHHTLFSSGEQSFDTRGMSVVKMRDDLFRHWVLGLGSGDLNIVATGARQAEFTIHNVLFIDTKLKQIQQLVAMRPDQTPDTVLTAGAPE